MQLDWNWKLLLGLLFLLVPMVSLCVKAWMFAKATKSSSAVVNSRQLFKKLNKRTIVLMLQTLSVLAISAAATTSLYVTAMNVYRSCVKLIAFPEHLFSYGLQVTFFLHTLNNNYYYKVVESPITFAVQGCVLAVLSRTLMARKSYIHVLLLQNNDFSMHPTSLPQQRLGLLSKYLRCELYLNKLERLF